MGILRALGAATFMFGLVACDPPPPRLQLTVDSTMVGADDLVGDGTCASAAAAGACTLQAAIEEGGASAHGADVLVGTGQYPAVTALITGDLRLEADPTDHVALMGSVLTVATGARLELIDINRGASPLGNYTTVQVHGTLELHRSVATVDVEPGGGLVAHTSVLIELEGGPALTNGGSVIAGWSSILAADFTSTPMPALVGESGATTHLAATVIAYPAVVLDGNQILAPVGGGCAGVAPASLGHLYAEQPCEPTAGAGDGSGPAGTVLLYLGSPGGSLAGPLLSLQPDSPLVDAIPLGHPLCDTSTTDLYGTPRGVDGDGDGVGGCDIGAIELASP